MSISITQTRPFSLATIDPKHYRELTEKRGLNPDWVAVNCRSVDAKTATEHLGYIAYSDGILLFGAGYQEQFKPDKPWKSTDGKSPKYRSCKDDGGYDVMLPSHPNSPNFWDDLEALKERCFWIDGHPCLMVTEGFFKAIALTSHGVPTVALLGVEQGLTAAKNDPQGKRYLVPELERLARAGFSFIVGFDADCATNDNVLKAQLKLAHQLALFGSPVYSVTGLWHEAEGKGIDDYIKMNGFEKFRDRVLSKAETIEQWKLKNFERLERQLNPDAKVKPPTPREIAQEIREDYQQKWKYHNEHKTWRYWNGKCWEETDDGVFWSTVLNEIDGRGINHSKPDYINNIVTYLIGYSRVFKWEKLDQFRYIPFENGVVETITGKLRKHCPDDSFTYFLPHKYSPVEVDNLLDTLKEKCPVTYQYMMTSQQNNRLMVRKMLATVNGVITGKFSQLQLFVQLIGKTRAGKGTFTRLLRECVGAKNHASASLKDLARPDFRASIIDKMLVEFPEQRSTNEEAISWLLALTGGDFISCKRLYKDPTSEKFYGTPIITSNRQIGTAKFPELDERLCLITFNNTIPKDKRIHGLDGLIKAEISPLIAIALSMSDGEVTQLLRGIGEGDNPEVRLYQWELRMEESTIAAFFNDRLIVDPSGKERNGKLWKAYEAYCHKQGERPDRIVSEKKFTAWLCETLENLDIKVTWNKSAAYARLEGVRLRDEVADSHIPTYSQLLDRQVREQIETSTSLSETPRETFQTHTPSPIETSETKTETTFLSEQFSPTGSSPIPLEPDPTSPKLDPAPSGPREAPLPDWKPGQPVKVVNPVSRFHGEIGIFKGFEWSDFWGAEIAVVSGLKEAEDSCYPVRFLELCEGEVPAKKPSTPAIPELAKLHPAIKDEWLWTNRKTRKPVWIESDEYIGMATIYGEPLPGDKLKEWRFSPQKGAGLILTPSDNVSVLKSELGKFKEIAPAPAGEQMSLFD